MDFGVIVAIAAVLIALIAIGTYTRSKWGINFAPMKCPNCGAPVPRIRRPKSLNQAMWGGWTCEQCGTNVDKWGRAVVR